MASKLQIVVPTYAFFSDKAALRKTLRSAGAEVAAVARSLIRKSQQSTPGMPPVNRTGNLASHLVVKVARSGTSVSIADTARSATGSGAPYALFLEDGAKGGGGKKGSRNVRKRINGKSVLVSVSGSRVALPHPFLSTALDQRESSVAQRVQEAVVSGIKFVRIKA